MINDVYSRFKDLYIQTNGKILTSKFELEKEPALCIKIDEDGKVLNTLVVDKNVQKNDLYDWFSLSNLKAKYLNSNKAVGNKMIFSNSNLALFGRFDTFPMITKESFIKLFDVKEDQTNKKTTAKSLFFKKYQGSIDTIFLPKKFYFLDEFIHIFDNLSDEELNLLTQESFIAESALRQYYDKLVKDYSCTEKQFFTEDKVLYILSQIQLEFQEYAHKAIKLKIFRDNSLEDYEKAEIQYLDSSLFAVEDKDKQIGTLGLPFLDNTLNTSKPFMIHHSTKYKIAFPKSKDEILYIKYLDDYLSINKGIFYLELEKFTTQNEPFLHSKVGQFVIMKKTKYELFEYLPSYIDEFEKKPFEVKNYLQIMKNKVIVDNKKPFTEMYLLENELDNLFYKKLKTNYLSEKIAKTNGKLVTLIFLVRQACFDYFKKGQIVGKDFYRYIANILTDIIIYQYEHIEDDKKLRINMMEFLNLKLSMNHYYKGDDVNIQDELNLLQNKISATTYENLSKREFLLLAGQMGYYLVSQSESNNRTFRLVEHYLKSKNVKMLKNHLRNDLEKYKHKISLTAKDSKFKNGYAMLLAFEDGEKFTHDDMDLLLIGLITENIFYMKKEEN
jgi:CRISPR-associated protein Csh1